MAICHQCGQEMTKATSCISMGVEYPDGEVLKEIPYGKETAWSEYKLTPPQTCHDCGVALGSIHHPGCDMERCPRCGGQLIGCGCLSDEDESY